MSRADSGFDGSDDLGALDQLMFRGEANPRTRSGVLGVEILDRTPEWDRYVQRFDAASRVVLRMRQKVVTPTLPTAAPRWVVDPDFNLAFHVRRVRAPAPGTLREVLDLAEVLVQSPMDTSRPLWTATLVEGLEGGRAASLLHLSHAVSDGVGAVEMFAHLYDLERDPPRPAMPSLPVPQELSSNDLMRLGISGLPGAIVRVIRTATSAAAGVAEAVIRTPKETVSGMLDYASSGARVMDSSSEHSPVLRGRSLSTRTETIDIPFSDLRRAAKQAGGSLNDAYLAGLCGALRLYHEAMGVPIDTIPLAVPVNLRSEGDAAGGNQFAGITLAAPIGTVDPVARILEIRTQMLQKREEPAIGIIGAIAPALNLLPSAVLDTVTSAIVPPDVQASNVPTFLADTYLAGAKVLRQYGLGPLPGVAIMVVMVSRSGYCSIAARCDRAAVSDASLFARCLRAGFDEVLAIAVDGDRRPASVSSVAAPSAKGPS